MLSAGDVQAMDRPALRALLGAGHPIAPGALDDSSYHGTSLGLPGLVVKLTWKHFRKVFQRDPSTGALRGWNVRLKDDVTFGHYGVVPLEGRTVPAPCGDGLLIDYGLGSHGPLSLLRDPIVAVNAGSSDLLLGWTYVELGALRFGTPSFFTLERER